MTLTADVLDRTPLPVVRLIGTGVPNNTRWTLTGRTPDTTWEVASAVGDGREVVVADPWAPVNVPVSYELAYGASADSAGPVERPYAGEHPLTSLDGRSVADFLWMKSGGDARDREPRAEWFDVPGAYLSPGVFDRSAGAGTGSLVVRTVGPHTSTLRALVKVNLPVILHHNEARCRIPQCDVPLVRTAFLTGAPEDRTARVDVAERSWSLSYRPVPKPYGWVPPVVTVGDFMAAFPKVEDVVAGVPDEVPMPDPNDGVYDSSLYGSGLYQ